MSRARTRRKRRQARQAQRHGVRAKPTHRARAGRTGGVHAKKTPPKSTVQYQPAPARTIAEAVACPKCGARPGEQHAQHR